MRRRMWLALALLFVLIAGTTWIVDSATTNHIQIEDVADRPSKGEFVFSANDYKQGILSYLHDLQAGDLGSLHLFVKGRETTTDMLQFVLERAWRSALTLLPSLLLGIVIGVGAGIVTFFLPKTVRQLLHAWNQLVFSTPDVLWVFILILLVIQIDQWAGFPLIKVAEVGGQRAVVLPIASVALPITSYMYFYTVHAVGEFLMGDVVRAARSKGLPGRIVFMKYVMRPATDSLLTVIPKMAAMAASSLVVVEYVYNIFGVTWYMGENPKLTATLMMALAIFVIGIQWISSLLRLWLNPLLRKQVEL